MRQKYIFPPRMLETLKAKKTFYMRARIDLSDCVYERGPDLICENNILAVEIQ